MSEFKYLYNVATVSVLVAVFASLKSLNNFVTDPSVKGSAHFWVKVIYFFCAFAQLGFVFKISFTASVAFLYWSKSTFEPIVVVLPETSNVVSLNVVYKLCKACPFLPVFANSFIFFLDVF